MNHVEHIKKNKHLLDLRWNIIREIRTFFWEQQFQEVETPLLVKHPGQEPYLSPMQVGVKNEKKEVYQGYLHTSPEYTMKKMLAAGYERIFFLGKTFRNEESFGGFHNPEFTMIEWYRSAATMEDLMNDIDLLLTHLSKLQSVASLSPAQRISMKELWKQIIGVDLEQYLTPTKLYNLCIEKGYNPQKNEPYEDLFYRIFLNEIEPKLASMGSVIIYHYPKQMAALAKISEQFPNYAERFELYIKGIEIANAFGELTNGKEQRKRFEKEQRQRVQLKKEAIAIDEEFLVAVDLLPESSGIALGVDRLIQAVVGQKTIDDLLPLGAQQLWS